MQISLFNFPPIMGLGLLVASFLSKPSLVYTRSQRVYIITFGFEYVTDRLLAKKFLCLRIQRRLFFVWVPVVLECSFRGSLFLILGQTHGVTTRIQNWRRIGEIMG